MYKAKEERKIKKDESMERKRVSEDEEFKGGKSKFEYVKGIGDRLEFRGVRGTEPKIRN